MILNLEDLSKEEKLKYRKLCVSQATSEVLAAYVVVYKTLGMDKDFAVSCMEELSWRRFLGEDFDFEEFIEIESNKIPKVDAMDILKMSKNIMGNVNIFKVKK